MRLPHKLKKKPAWTDTIHPQEKKQRWDAAVSLVTSLQKLTESGEQVVQAMIGAAPFVEWEHYPENDVRDEKRASQYFYHAHPGRRRPFVEHGHFHLFVHAEELGLRKKDAGFSPAPAHVIAVSMTAQGIPSGFFTVNRWVTKGTWLSLPECTMALDTFEVKGRSGNGHIHRFLKSLITLYRPHILALIKERDRIMEKLCRERDRRSVFADRSIEVLNYCPIALMDDIVELEALM
ncbi:MAG: hypothetical protein K2P84_13830 [Undibacterium sp.]|nr:hypothetical protein [Undibacterium sp.]